LWILLALSSPADSVYATQNLEPEKIDKIMVIGVTPLPGANIDLSKIPSNIQRATGEDISRQNSLNLTEFTQRNFGSVSVNEAQGNPFQADVRFRGYVASPLLGIPQGMSVYQDGARVNEPFGDTVNWSVIPESAIASVDLVPGSNPLFGLNTLGGALFKTRRCVRRQRLWDRYRSGLKKSFCSS
jgi:iron complex outermembrane receptor protein